MDLLQQIEAGLRKVEELEVEIKDLEVAANAAEEEAKRCRARRTAAKGEKLGLQQVIASRRVQQQVETDKSAAAKARVAAEEIEKQATATLVSIEKQKADFEEWMKAQKEAAAAKE